MRQFLAIATMLIVAAGSLLTAAPSHAQSKGEIVIGVQCDRTGPTQVVGTVLCPGFHDYVALVNSKGGVEGFKIKALEIDHEYKVPPAVEAYERHKKEGAVTMAVYGTPQIYALAAKLTEDRIPGTSPGFGSAAAADGVRYPYIFPIAATYWSQGAAAVDFVKKQLGGNLKGKKIAFIFYDNPAGREPIEVLEDLAAKEGFQLKTFAVPPPGVEMGAQVLDIAQRFRADFVIGHLFGGSPQVSIKEFKRVGYPLKKFVSFVWGAGEANIEGAGGFAVAEGYYVMQFAGVGSDYPVLNEIREMYKKQGKEPPKEMASTVFYNRGVLIGALHVEAIRNALKAKPDGKITGVDTKNGFEKISNFTLGGLVPPLKITPTDHEGGGLVQIWQVKDGKFVKVTDWFAAYQDVVANVEVIYDGVILVLKGVSLNVREGGITTLLGANGAGKTTTLKAVSGLLRSERGDVTKGSIEFNGRRIDRLAPHAVVRQGIVQVFEGRRVFEHLTTEENLIAGAHIQTDRQRVAAGIERVYGYFPRLKERRGVQAGYLSGGEQQMLVIGRALMASPHVMLLDEPSLGLAPMLVEEIFGIVQQLNRQEKLTVLLVEQNATLALTIADHGYVMENGRIVLDGTAAMLTQNADIKEFYLGLTEVGGRKSYRDVKHYKRRKRWLS